MHVWHSREDAETFNETFLGDEGRIVPNPTERVFAIHHAGSWVTTEDVLARSQELK